jgi:hypothetical protein
MKFNQLPNAINWSLSEVLINEQMSGNLEEFKEMINKVNPSQIHLRLVSIQGDEYYFEGFWIK